MRPLVALDGGYQCPLVLISFAAQARLAALGDF